MKHAYVFACTALLWAGACSFDRGPRLRPPPRPVVILPFDAAAPIVPPPASPPAILVDSGGPQDPILPVDAATVAPGDFEDAGGDDVPDAPEPVAPQCSGTFCPVPIAPGVVCCTAQTDVERRTARAVGTCGVDLSAVQSNTYGIGCWQRDQLGILDNTCPALAPESGCCTEKGECGTLNAEHKLGCRHALGSAAQECGKQPDNAACEPTGNYAIRVDIDVTWGGRAGVLAELTDDGRGFIHAYLLAKLEHLEPGEAEFMASTRVCGAVFPAFESTTLCESYQAVFPTELWESPQLPQLTLPGRYECNDLGCVLSLEPYTYLLGIELFNPDGAWPTADQTATFRCRSGRGAECFPDPDGDGRPGVQVTMQKGGTVPATNGACGGEFQRRAVPLAESIATLLDGARRADRVQMGVRIRLGGSARMSETCDRGAGSALADYVNARVQGCLIEPGTFNVPNFWTAAGPNEACTPEEARFVDLNIPDYTLLAAGAVPASSLRLSNTAPSLGPEVRVIRLGPASENFECDAVRAAAF